MQQLETPISSDAVRRLFAPLAHHHLALAQILDGLTPGVIIADHPHAPTCALAWFHSRAYLAVLEDSAEPCLRLPQFFQEDLLPRMRTAGIDGFILHCEPEPQEADAHKLLPDHKTIYTLRHHYTLYMDTPPAVPDLPQGFSFRLVDHELLVHTDLKGLDWLREEMVSEQPSVDAFLANCFGVALIFDDEVIGWCLSEYGVEDGCEVGVAVAEQHQRRGLGKATTLAFLAEAYRRGVHRVGWHCWARNIPSGRLALSAGFQLQVEFPVILCLLNSPRE